jgi:plastocyanin
MYLIYHFYGCAFMALLIICSHNGTFSYKFTAAGTYQYHCTFHSMMTAEVIVN